MGKMSINHQTTFKRKLAVRKRVEGAAQVQPRRQPRSKRTIKDAANSAGPVLPPGEKSWIVRAASAAAGRSRGASGRGRTPKREKDFARGLNWRGRPGGACGSPPANRSPI